MTDRLERTLPARRSRVIGRQRELDEVRRRLNDPDHRLLTLTGVGGIGKTTIAIESARLAVGEDLAAIFVDLAPARDTNDIALRCCDALGLLQLGRPPVQLLVEHLVPRQMLLVLDDCERTAGPLRALVDRLLDRCPDVRIVATSRAPLRIRGEAVLAVQPMSLPGPEVLDLEGIASSPAVALFVERATAADAMFKLDAGSALTVAAICRHVDGVPLALELIAATTAALTPREIHDRLTRRAARVGDDPRAEPGPLDATLDWSYASLTPQARALYRRLAVFVGGWTVDAAERVGEAGDDQASMRGPLVELVEHSLVVRGWHGDASRYRMLAPVADHAMRCLDEAGERDAVATAHAEYYLGLVGRHAVSYPMSDPEQLDLVDQEYGNCEAAMRYAERAGLVPLVTGFALSLLTFWGVRGLLHTAIRRLDAALTIIGPGASGGRGAILGGLAAYHRLVGQHAIAAQRALESERVFEEIGEPSGRATAIGLAGEIAIDLDDIPGALDYYDRARAALGPTPDPLLLAVWHGNVGGIALHAGEYERARRELDQAMATLQGRSTWYLVQLLVRLGRLDRLDGRLDSAASHLRAALAQSRRYDARIDGILCLEELARLATDQGHPLRAATLLAAATGIRDATGVRMTPHDRRLLRGDIDHVRGALPSARFEEAWRRGLGMDLDRAATFAATPTERHTAGGSVLRGSVLTPREREIADLVALGLTNRQIADRLAIAPGTARIHVERILGKLGLTSRVQVATWVVRSASGVSAQG